MPVYNAEKHLRKCLDSLLNQEWQNREILLIDDGSTDGSPAICDEYAENYGEIRVIHKENEGVSTARNIGIRESTGKYIHLCDADDWLEPQTYSELLPKMEKAQADTAFFGWAVDMDVNGNLQSVSQADDAKGGVGDQYDIFYSFLIMSGAYGGKMGYGNYVWNKIFRKSTIFEESAERKESEDSTGLEKNRKSEPSAEPEKSVKSVKHTELAGAEKSGKTAERTESGDSEKSGKPAENAKQILFDPAVKIAEDGIWLVQAAQRWKIGVFDPRPYYHYLRNPDSVMNTFKNYSETRLASQESHMKMLQILRDFNEEFFVIHRDACTDYFWYMAKTNPWSRETYFVGKTIENILKINDGRCPQALAKEILGLLRICEKNRKLLNRRTVKTAVGIANGLSGIKKKIQG